MFFFIYDSVLSDDFWKVLNNIAFLEGSEDSLSQKVPDEMLTSYHKKQK